LLHWRWKDVIEFTIENKIPRNPLYEKGYTSIGCKTCTTLPKVLTIERSGRDKDKEEVMRRLRELGYF